MEITAFNYSETEFSTQGVSNSKKSAVAGDDIKEAFLSLLQSLVGANAMPNSNIQQILNTSKIEIEKKDVSREEFQVEYQKHDDTGFEAKKADNTSLDESTSKEAKSGEIEVVEAVEKGDQEKEVVTSNNEVNTEQVVEQSVSQQVSQDNVSAVETKEISTDKNIKITELASQIVEENNRLSSVDENLLNKNNKSNLELQSNKNNNIQNNAVDSAELVLNSESNVLTAEVKDKVSRKLEAIGAQKKAYDPINNPLELSNSSESKLSGPNLSSSLVDPGVKKSVDNINFIQGLGARSNSGESLMNNSFNKASFIKTNDPSSVIGIQNKSTDKTSSERLTSSSVQKKSADAQAYVDKVKEVLNNLALSKSNDSITIKIDPPHLGEITVRVSQKLGEIHAKIMPESKEVEKTLLAKTSELSLVIQALGFREDQIKVTIGRQGEEFSQYQGDKENRFSSMSEFPNNNQDLKSDRKSFKDQDALGIFLGIEDNDSGARSKSSAGLDISGWVA